MPITLVIVEDLDEVREGLMNFLALSPEFKVLDTFKTAEEALEAIPRLQPDIVIMDINLPGISGIECIRRIKDKCPDTQFMMFTIYEDDEKIFEAIQAGATGYLLKHEPAEILQEAVMTVMEFGGAPMSPAIARKTLKLLSQAEAPAETSHGTMPEVITDREQEILQYMVSGWDAKRISVVLNISVLTVRKHIANIYEKLHVSSKAQVISLAHKNKWV